jgi:DNA invertase Pin-like site-specific DNA recombinase
LYIRVPGVGKIRHGDAAVYDHNPEAQVEQLKTLAAQRGWQLAGVYSDQASGTKEHRPGLDRLLADADYHRFDVVAVWQLEHITQGMK